jgi:site-specific recombinase
MNSNDPGVMMPEVGRSIVHQEGVNLITEYIKNLKVDASRCFNQNIKYISQFPHLKQSKKLIESLKNCIFERYEN